MKDLQTTYKMDFDAVNVENEEECTSHHERAGSIGISRGLNRNFCFEMVNGLDMAKG